MVDFRIALDHGLLPCVSRPAAAGRVRPLVGLNPPRGNGACDPTYLGILTHWPPLITVSGHLIVLPPLVLHWNEPSGFSI